MTVVGGTGYVGLTTAACLAHLGHKVYCVGRNSEKIRMIKQGVPPIYEEGLAEILNAVMKKNMLVATRNLKDSVVESSVTFICTGTPSRRDGSIDLSQVVDAAKQVGSSLSNRQTYSVVVVKSTVVPGTTESTVIPILEKTSGKTAGLDFGVCMNPEFLREGSAVKDFLFPEDQGIVVGELDRKSGDDLLSLYKDLDGEVFRTTIRTAEMIKYARNSYLAKDISFANEIANICQKLGIDFQDVKRGLEMDSRIGKGRFLNAGLGFGGSCFPKDVKALVAKAKEAGIEPRILEATLKVNESQPDVLIGMIKRVFGDIKNRKFAVLGLAFKPGTSDMREARSIPLIENLLGRGANVYAFDPQAAGEARKIFGCRIQYTATAEEALRKADACIIAAEWPMFSDPNLYNSLHGNFIFDGRRALDSKRLASRFVYQAIGFPERSNTI